MDPLPQEDRFRRQWLTGLLEGLSFTEACRVYVLKSRPAQYLSAPPVEDDGHFRRAMKWFPANDPAQKHCCSREELIAEAARITGLPGREACALLHRLFAFQPELTFREHGAVCKSRRLF